MRITKTLIILCSLMVLFSTASCSKSNNTSGETNTNNGISTNHSDSFIKIRTDTEKSDQTLADKLAQEQYWEHVEDENLNPEDVVMATVEAKLDKLEGYKDADCDTNKSVEQNAYAPITWMELQTIGAEGMLIAQALEQASKEQKWDTVKFEIKTGIENTDDWVYTIYTFSDGTNAIKIATDFNGTVKYKRLSNNN